MWYLVVNQESERYFIKNKGDDEVYFVKENSSDVQIKTFQELREDGFRIVGEAFENECMKLDELLQVAL